MEVEAIAAELIGRGSDFTARAAYLHADSEKRKQVRILVASHVSDLLVNGLYDPSVDERILVASHISGDLTAGANLVKHIASTMRDLMEDAQMADEGSL